MADHFLEDYLDYLTSKGNPELSASVAKTATDVWNNHISGFSYTTHEIGLLFGNVQSGKTAQMFGIISRCADEGFPVFIILTTDNNTLQDQTLERVRKDLKGFCICGENDSHKFIDNQLLEPVIIVLKKNVRILKLWTNVLVNTNFMKGNPLFIIDDEGDAASLNTLVNRGKQSSINRYLSTIKDSSSCSLYLQVTGTPQALFLQSDVSNWHPFFTYYFKPGKGYLGGDFFFSPSKLPESICLIDSKDDYVRVSVVRHLAITALIMQSGGTVSNALYHPGIRQSIHEELANEVALNLTWCRNNLNKDFHIVFAREYKDLKPIKYEKTSIEQAFKKISTLLKSNEINIIVMNAKNATNTEDYAKGCNFIIGGNSLGRGVTFPSLQTIFYTRSAKKPQADTMWQHSRMFGYDRDTGLMKVYIDERLYKLFSNINATNNSIISQVQRGIDDVKVYYPMGLAPTRKNVIDDEYIISVSGGTNYFPSDPDNATIDEIDELLAPFSSEAYYMVNLKLIDELLSHIVPSDDFRMKAFKSVINTLRAEKSSTQGILIVRRERDITQGTGALLSPNDWKLGETFPDRIVLTMYQVLGTKGWKREKLWVPNIKLPHGIVYYDRVDA